MSVRSTGYVWAVGAWTDLSIARGLIQHWNGSSWVTVPTEPLTADILVMEDVSVTSDGARAYSVGEYWNADVNRFRTLGFRWC